MDTIKICPVCNSSKFSTFLDSKDFFLSNEAFTIQKCNSCGFKFTNPRPDMADLGRYYESLDYISHSNEKKGIVNSIYQLVRSYTVKRKVNLLNSYFRDGTALDIGCGSGEFLNELKKNKWNVTGVEPNNSARDFAIRKYNLKVFDEDELDSFNEGSFDVITMWHVLEHVFDLNERILQLKRLMSKNGNLVIALPNADSIDAKVYGKFWAAYDLPRHLYHFNKTTVEMLFRKHGYKITKVKPMLFDSFYVCMLSEKYKSGKINFPKAIINGLRSNLAASFKKKNYSSIIYVLELNNS